MKKKWGKPKLIVLIRGMPEESALSSCKIAYIFGPESALDTCALEKEWACKYPCENDIGT